MDEKEKAKRFVSKSRRSKPKPSGSVAAGKMKSKCRKSKKHEKSSTTSKSNSAVSPHRENLEEKKEILVVGKEEKKEEKKAEPQEKKKGERTKEDKEPSSDSDHDGDLGMKRSHVALPSRKGKPKKVAIQHRDVDEKEMERLLKKLQENKSQPPRPPVTLDEKSKIFMDRVDKKPYPHKYSKKSKALDLVDDDAEYFKKPTAASIKKKCSESVIPVEDSYDKVPKLSEVLKMPGENVFVPTMMRGEVPFWAVDVEPDENDLKDIEPPISVGSEHVEAYQNKTLQLKTPKSTKLVLDEFQPSCLLSRLDEKFFHPHLVFSNTVRSLVNVQGHEPDGMPIKSPMTRSEDDGDNYEESTQPEYQNNVTISKNPSRHFCYERSRPILSAREAKDRLIAASRKKSTRVVRESLKDIEKETNMDMEPKQKLKS